MRHLLFLPVIVHQIIDVYAIFMLFTEPTDETDYECRVSYNWK